MKSYKVQLLSTQQRLARQIKISTFMVVFNVIIVVAAWWLVIESLNCKG